jgi:hypothetical protein
MPELPPGALFAGVLAALTVVMLRSRAGKPRLSFITVMAIGIAGAYVIPPAAAFLGEFWHAQTWLPDLPVVTSGQIFIGAWVAFAVYFIANQKGQPRRVPVWAALAAGVAAAVLFPPFIDRVTGRYQNASLRADVNHCTRGMLGQVQPREATNICDEPITVGLCMPGETNPTPCAQTFTIAPGETARFDPGDASLSSLPSNLNGLTVVACRPPARPSRAGQVHGRGYEGVCLPPA